MSQNAMLSDRFPRSVIYRAPSAVGASVVRESGFPENAFRYSERHLQCVWADPMWRPKALLSSTGETVVVEEPGRWNLEAGPDFLDASVIIEPGHRRLKGDVEVHIQPSDWQNHHHAADPAYSAVTVHVSYGPGVLPAEALPAGAVQVSLRDALRADPLFSFESIDVTAYPYGTTRARRPPCAEALASWSPDDVAALLESAGEERLRVKAARMDKAIRSQGAEQTFYEEVLCALGYKQNRMPFRQLARRLPLARLRERASGNTIKAHALLLGVAGLLPSATPSLRYDPPTQALVRTLWDHWWKDQAEWADLTMSRSMWRLSAIRPQNRPGRRLAAAATLFAGPHKDLGGRMAELDARTPKAWLQQARALFEVADPSGYWSRRFSFAGAESPSDVALIGSRRQAAILGNVAIPFLAACGGNVAPLLDHLPAAQDNALIRETAFSLFGQDHNPAAYRHGLRQQGLLQVFHDFCLHNRSRCQECTFPAHLQQMAP